MALTFGGGERESQAAAQAASQAQAPNGMLTGMTAEELSRRIPGPGSYYYNQYKKENPALLAEAEALRQSRRNAAASSIANPVVVETNNSFAIPNVSLRNTNTGSTTVVDPATANPVVVETDNSFAIPNGSFSNTITDSTTTVEPAMSYDERRYRELLGRGVIDEQGNILKPQGLNPTEIMRGEPPSWASPELIKNAYIQAFESKARGGQDFMESGDYQNFLNAGYSLTQDQIKAIDGVRGQGSQGGLTFGGGETSTGVANPPPTVASELDAQQQQLNQNFIKFLEALGLGSLVTAFQSGTTPDLSGIGMMSGGNSGGGYIPYAPQLPTVAPIDFTASVLPKNTVGYDPVRGLYNIPDAQTQQTVTEQTGLFNYIYGPQG